MVPVVAMHAEDNARHSLVAADPPAKSLTVWGFSGKPLDFPKS